MSYIEELEHDISELKIITSYESWVLVRDSKYKLPTDKLLETTENSYVTEMNGPLPASNDILENWYLYETNTLKYKKDHFAKQYGPSVYFTATQAKNAACSVYKDPNQD